MTSQKSTQNISESTARITLGNTTLTLRPDGTIVTTTVRPEETETETDSGNGEGLDIIATKPR
jgi:hypothetical protein